MSAKGSAAERLTELGLDALQVRIYLELLERPEEWELDDLRARLDADPRSFATAIDALAAEGLVTRRATTCLPAPPDVALESMIERRRRDLEAAHAVAAELGREFRRVQSASRGDRVMYVDGSSAVRRWVGQIERAAQQELLILDRPPYAAPPARTVLDHQLATLSAGVRCRTIYDRRSIAFNGNRELMQLATAAGEQARVIPHLPLKLALADRTLAIVSLWTTGVIDGAVVVRQSSLLDALREIFEFLWDHAVPLDGQPEGPTDRAAPTSEEREILALIAAGFNDDAIAYRLGISPRTLARRLAAMLKKLGAATRFQAGYLAAKRGWM